MWTGAAGAFPAVYGPRMTALEVVGSTAATIALATLVVRVFFDIREAWWVRA